MGNTIKLNVIQEKPVEEDSANDSSWIFTEDKLLFHKDKIKEFQETGVTFPVAFDIDLTNLCGHRCPHCCGSRNISREDKGTDSTHQDFERLKRLLSEIKELGGRSVTYAGGGDPSLYPHFTEILRYTKSLGLDIGMYTNGHILKEECLDAMIDCCAWIRVSLDADSPEIYEIAHGMPGKVFFTVVNNIRRLIERKKAKQKNVTISTCFLIGPKTLKAAYGAAKLSRELDVDHIRIRPYFQMPGDDRTRLQINETFKFLEKCKELETEGFKVSYPMHRVEWMDDKNRVRKYKKCYAVHFLASITPDENVYPCCNMKDKPITSLGNIKEKSFKDVWYNENRKSISDKIDFRLCPNPCNYEKQVKFLWDIIESGKPFDEYCKEKNLTPPQQKGIHKNFL